MADFVDFLPNVWRYVTADSAVRALVSGGTIGADAAGGAYEYDVLNGKFGWIFRDIGDQLPPRNVENTGKAAVLFSQFDYWSPQLRHHTSKFPILTVSIFADVSRDAPLTNPGLPQSAEQTVGVVWRQIDRLFHDPANRVHAFDQLRIVSTVEGSPLSVMDVPDGDGIVRGTVRYDITL